MSYLSIDVRWPKPKVAGDYLALEPGNPKPCYARIRRNGLGGLDIDTGALVGSLGSLSDDWKFSMPIVISSTITEEERIKLEAKRHSMLQKETVHRLKSARMPAEDVTVRENIKVPFIVKSKKIPKKLIDYCRSDKAKKELERNGASWASRRSR